MEVSVSFTGEGEIPDPAKYLEDTSPVGKVYIPRDGVLITGPIGVRYEKHPWIEQFELDGIKAAPAKRTGYGTKNARGFVRSLGTIYARAYDEYREYGGDEAFDAGGYFAHAAEHFLGMAENPGAAKIFRSFCGFTENMWREGDPKMYHIAMDVMLPMIRKSGSWDTFEGSITDEFREYISNLDY